MGRTRRSTSWASVSSDGGDTRVDVGDGVVEVGPV
jgi:hypothetical protein